VETLPQLHTTSRPERTGLDWDTIYGYVFGSLIVAAMAVLLVKTNSPVTQPLYYLYDIGMQGLSFYFSSWVLEPLSELNRQFLPVVFELVWQR
jgi:hypothetical protein